MRTESYLRKAKVSFLVDEFPCFQEKGGGFEKGLEDPTSGGKGKESHHNS